MPIYRDRPLVFRDFPAGQPIFQENDPGETMFIVRSGRVRLTLSKMNVETVEAGGFLGEMVLLHNAPRTTSAIAETDCSLQELDSHAFIDHVRITYVLFTDLTSIDFWFLFYKEPMTTYSPSHLLLQVR